MEELTVEEIEGLISAVIFYKSNLKIAAVGKKAVFNDKYAKILVKLNKLKETTK